MAALNTTTFAYALKTLYSKQKVENLCYADNPWMAMCPKDSGFGGANFVQPLIYGHVAAVGADFAKSQLLKAGSPGAKFTVTRVKGYSFANIDGETILASKGNERAFMEAVKREIDSALHGLSRWIAKGMYGDGSGKIGTNSEDPDSPVSATNLILANADDITNFEVGMVLTSAADIDSAPRNSGGLCTVSAINRDLGSMTVNSQSTAWAGGAAGDAIFCETDYDSAADRNCISGLASYIPGYGETVAALFGMTRTTDSTRLAGHRIDGTALGLDEALVKLVARVAREGHKPGLGLMSYEKCEELVNLLGSKVQYVTHKVGEIGFDGFKVTVPGGSLTVFPDQNCPSNRAYALTKDTWKLRSLGGSPMILDIDGSKWLREALLDSYELRCGFYGNMTCSAPGYNGVVNL